MKTLIELYDERAIENAIGPETFCPERIVYLCPPGITEDRQRQQKWKDFFASRGLHADLVFTEISIFKTDKILAQLQKITTMYPDCVLDVTGGTDAALFAAGMFCKETGIPAFTYSRKKNCFYDISNASFADERICNLEYRVEDFFRMAGGTMRKGRVDNHILGNYMDKYDDFFRVFLNHRAHWTEAITFFQNISQTEYGESVSMHIEGSYYQRGNHGRRVFASRQLLNDLQNMGFLHNVHVEGEERVSFDFADEQVRSWLRDVGSVLELYLYKACCDTGIFGEVISSAVVDWDGTVGQDSVSNEIDVVASRGVVPVFISCKACEVKTEAINELAILRDRFGGKGARAVIATTELCNAAARHRCQQLDIAVIDLEELESGRAADRIRIIMKADKQQTKIQQNSI